MGGSRQAVGLMVIFGSSRFSVLRVMSGMYQTHVSAIKAKRQIVLILSVLDGNLRHTWQVGTFKQASGNMIYTMSTLGNPESPEMARRYAHLSGEQLA